jgi:TM2 domain-containing membrane protein YozV
MSNDSDLAAAQNLLDGNMDNQKMMIYMTQKKSEVLAAVLSFFIPGLGQLVTGYIGKGIIFLFSTYITLFLAVLLTFILIGFLLYPVCLVLWIWSIVDAYSNVKKFNITLMQQLQNN